MGKDFSLHKYFKKQYISEALSRANSKYVTPTTSIPKSTSEYITDKSKSTAEKETSAMRSPDFEMYDKDDEQPYINEDFAKELSSDILNYADQYHMELVDTLKSVSTHLDKKTGGFYVKFPHYNGPDYTGATFGKDVVNQIEKSKAAAKEAAQKTISKFKDYIEDYEITDSKSGVYGDVWLWIMPKSFHQFENKPLKGPGGLGEAYNGKSEYTEDEVKYSIGVDDDYEGWVDVAFQKGFKYDENKDQWYGPGSLDEIKLKENSISRLKDKVKDMSKEDFIALVKKVGDLDKWKNASKGKFDDGTPIRPFSNAGDRVEVIDNNFEEKDTEKYLIPLKEGSMQARELADSYSLKQLQSRYDNIWMDMEEEAEPEGGPIADQYADELHAYEEAIQIAKQKIRGGSTNSGEMTYDQAIKKHYGKSPTGVHPSGKPKFDESLNEATEDEIAQALYSVDYEQLEPDEKERVNDVQDEMGDTLLNESTESKWNAIDVSRTAEKELSNKEWNERTAKKLEMLIKLNAAGKFKKDFDKDRLQGWVDQNFSWERVSRQFKNIGEGSCGYTPDGKPRKKPAGPHLLKLKERIFNSFRNQ